MGLRESARDRNSMRRLSTEPTSAGGPLPRPMGGAGPTRRILLQRTPDGARSSVRDAGRGDDSGGYWPTLPSFGGTDQQYRSHNHCVETARVSALVLR